MFKENLAKKGPLSREFWTEKPTHMGGTYPYPRHIMLPPPGTLVYCKLVSNWKIFSSLWSLIKSGGGLKKEGVYKKILAQREGAY